MSVIYSKLISGPSDWNEPVLATVVRTSGSAPQKPGSTALFSSKKLLEGTVGGGAVEGRITETASSLAETGIAGLYHFNMVPDISRKDEPICGGQITILIDPKPLAFSRVFEALAASMLQNEPGVLITSVEGDDAENVVLERFWYTSGNSATLPWPETGLCAESIIKNGDHYAFMEVKPASAPSTVFFLEAVFPPQKLIIAGAGHIGRALARLGRMTGFDVTVIDDREEYANNANIPDASRIIAAPVEETVRGIDKGPGTYLVIVTRGHKDDADALRAAIGSGFTYIGMIGSRKKINVMKDEFIAQGWATEAQWNEVFTPVGLEIHAQTVEEIAVSIIAQVILVKNSKRGKRASCPS